MFTSRESCLSVCAPGERGEREDERPQFCRVQPEDIAGCRPGSRETKFYFSATAGRCRSFESVGCERGRNVFLTRRECEQACGDRDAGGEVENQPRLCRVEPEEDPNCRPGRRETKYYFSTAVGRCRSFVSVGCERGRNVFLTARECEEVCENRDTDDGGGGIPQFCRAEPEDDPNCLPGDRQTKYYFSAAVGRCRSFVSVDCERGRNVFLTRRECEQACSGRDEGGGERPQFCRAEPEAISNCRPGDRETKYYFSAADGRCRSFVSLGCERGRNMFFTMRECREACDASDTEGAGMCLLPSDPGPCAAFETRWYRDPASGTCETFQYGGCEGNSNNFLTRAECLERCQNDNRAENEICNQPPETNDRPCRDEVTRYFWDLASGACRSFRYSGCGATANNFRSLRDCRTACRGRDSEGGRPPTQQRCLEAPEQKPADTSSCGRQQKRYTYSSRRGFCVPFTYTGCTETSNNFMTREECRDTCQPRDQCTQRQESGRCDGRLARFAYDTATNRCRRFTYSGCGGNQNRFKSERACLLSCGSGAAVDSQEVCLLPPVEDDAVNCGVRESRYFFDSALGRCVSFTFTGCVPTENNFLNLADCQQMCQAEEMPQLSDREVCALERAPGFCLGRLLRFFYDAEERRCRPFMYTGCDGNANSFLTFRDCSTACAPRLRSLRLDESTVVAEVKTLMDKMAASEMGGSITPEP
ncbi:papilin-like [Pollicipes pollicipes]|uniref:papilin-like n=1 Tax=Pollicipes pollicipes TaxID=41117 RepID=UPI001885591C|nr:papilin-like [Pollicipes pollicipes]